MCVNGTSRPGYGLAALVFLLACWGPGRAAAQPVGDALEAYVRLLQLAGHVPAFSFSVRPLSPGLAYGRLDARAGHPWADYLSRYVRPGAPPRAEAGLFDLDLRTYWNSARPWGQNDGAVWQGKGATLAFSGGGFARFGVLSLTLRPVLMYTGNAAFELSPLPRDERLSEYAYATEPALIPLIDFPERFGPEAFWTLDPGASSVRIDYEALAAGFSTENLWWGPGVRNAIIMSNNAPGFPHAFLGTARPANVGIGRLQARWIWGWLSESAYFDSVSTNDTRFLTGIVVDYTPKWIPGLSLGATRVYIQNTYPEKPGFQDYLIVFQAVTKKTLVSPENPTGEDNSDQMLSLFARWVFPESGVEVYGEWARGDHSWDLRDLVIEPEHAQGVTLGLQKAFALPGRRWVRLLAEHTNLEASRTNLLRSLGGSFFYVHTRVIQGYSQRGQVVGAGIGPGSSGQFVGLDWFAPWGKAGVFGFRQVHNNDRYYRLPEATNYGHEVEFGLGADVRVFYRDLELTGSLAWGRLLNRYYLFKNDQSNVNVGLAVRHSLMGFR